MSRIDPITEQLMAKGAPFEVVRRTVGGRDIRVFKQAPQNLTEVFQKARAFGDLEFIVAGDTRLTYAEFFKHADSMAGWLTAEGGLKPGQSVAICMKNCPEWMIAFVGIILAGGVAVLINSRGEPETMAQAVSDGDCVLVVADEKRLAKLRAGGCNVRDVPMDAATNFKPIPQSHLADPSDIAVMFFTSGTTGQAKAAAISHLALVTGVMNTQMSMAAIFTKMAADYKISVGALRSQMPQSCSLLVFPLFHTSGCSAIFLTALTTGGKLVLMERWDADKAMELVECERITALGGVPTMHWDILRSDKRGDYDLSSLMSLSCGGQALPLGLLNEIRQAFPRAFIGAGYGMTETSGAVSQANGEAFLRKPEASGTVLPMMDVRISDDDGNEVPLGATGEIWVKGATLMSGYYGRPKETAKRMSGDWFKTGDIGRLDSDGYIYIVDRKTDMVISGGENIYCAEVEQALGRHPSILEVATFGVPDDRLGERLVACAVVGDETTASDLIKYAADTLAAYKLPTDFIVTQNAFEHNAMGKVQKHKLRASYLEQLTNLESADASA